MITQRMILDAVNLQLVALGHGWAVHRDALPEQFERPCWFIAAEKQERKPIMINSDEINQQISILCVGNLDEDNRGNADELTAMADEIISMFTNDGYIKVNKRFLKIDSMKAERTAEDGFKVFIDLSYFDEARIKEEQPLIDEVITSGQVKEE